MKKWMVYDTVSGDGVFHETEENAQKDYNEAIEMISEGDERDHKVYLLEVKKSEEIELLA